MLISAKKSGSWHRLQAALWSFPKLEQYFFGPHPFEGPKKYLSLMPPAGRA
jgi:hypothetical protein